MCWKLIFDDLFCVKVFFNVFYYVKCWFIWLVSVNLIILCDWIFCGYRYIYVIYGCRLLIGMY